MKFRDPLLVHLHVLLKSFKTFILSSETWTKYFVCFLLINFINVFFFLHFESSAIVLKIKQLVRVKAFVCFIYDHVSVYNKLNLQKFLSLQVRSVNKGKVL